MEAEAIGDYTENTTARNAGMKNQSAMLDSQNRSRLSMMNADIGMREAEANAANRGAKKSVTDMYLNNMFTQFGQKSRDDKSYASQENYNNRMLEIYQERNDIISGGMGYLNEGDVSATSQIPDNIDPITGMPIEDWTPQYRSGGKLKRRFRTKRR